MKEKCRFVSVWDGGFEIESDAVFDRSTGVVSEVQIADLPESVLESLDILMRQYIITESGEYDVVLDEDSGTFFVPCGGILK